MSSVRTAFTFTTSHQPLQRGTACMFEGGHQPIRRRQHVSAVVPKTPHWRSKPASEWEERAGNTWCVGMFPATAHRGRHQSENIVLSVGSWMKDKRPNWRQGSEVRMATKSHDLQSGISEHTTPVTLSAFCGQPQWVNSIGSSYLKHHWWCNRLTKGRVPFCRMRHQS